MKIHGFKIPVVMLSILLLTSFCYTGVVEDGRSKPRNIILLIGDGMGVAQIYAGMTSNKGTLNLERITHVGMQKTYSADNYITDSAAGATALASGVKTKNGVVGKDTSGVDVKTILEYAEENGLATGMVSTSAITHATPAAFISHVDNRGMYEDIAAFFLDAGIDVFIGGGKTHFEKRKDSLNFLITLRENGYQVVTQMDEIPGITEGNLAGLVAEMQLPSVIDGRGDMLPVATNTAIQILNKEEDGFFLMVEGSQIDWGAHANNTEYITAEMVDFDLAIRTAIDFAQRDGETLVVITADHETGGMSLIGGDIQKGEVIANYGTRGHTSVMIPVFTFGPGAELFSGIYENTEIFEKLMLLYGFKKDATDKRK